MLMEMSFGADGLTHLYGNVLVCARCFQLHLTRLVKPCLIQPIHLVVLYRVDKYCETEHEHLKWNWDFSAYFHWEKVGQLP